MIASAGSRDEARPAIVLLEDRPVVAPGRRIGEGVLTEDDAGGARPETAAVGDAATADAGPGTAIDELDLHVVIARAGANGLWKSLIDALPSGVWIDAVPYRAAGHAELRQHMPVIRAAPHRGVGAAMQQHLVFTSPSVPHRDR